MLVLFETPAGYALFKVHNEGKLQEANIAKDFATLEGAQKVVSLKAFQTFGNTTEALAATTALVESKLGKDLKKFIKKQAKGEQLGVSDPKLAGIIKDKTGVQCLHNSMVNELVRGIRLQMADLITGLNEGALSNMALGLSHSLCRYKLKFSPDKVDHMIIQAIALLDDLDKESNTYAMRVKEWYGWHFPELAKVVNDNILFAKCVKAMGTRDHAAATSFAGILPEETETEVKEAAKISMGTEISEEDILNIQDLCTQVLDIYEYRTQLHDYLKNRMQAIAPNLSVMVGELVGARLIAHAGSLINLAKYPASTVQILGAEKALFRALKTKHETPKYGLIYHASLVGQAAPKDKGKISRLVASRSALAIRVDALGENATREIGEEGYQKVEQRLRLLEGGRAHAVSGKGRTQHVPAYDHTKSAKSPAAPRSTSTYNEASDNTMKTETASTTTTPKKEKKDKKKSKKDSDSDDDEMEVESKKDKKDKKKKEKKDKKKGSKISKDEDDGKKKKRKRDDEDTKSEKEKTPKKDKKKKKKTE
jgi:nucleolar protein 58